MFVHQEQLQHLLKPHHYFDKQQYQREQERIFQPTWHLAGTRADLPRPGDFVTFELLGRPVLLRNFDGEIHAFLNACAHRHSLLTSVPRGSAPTLRCQYHGWEYNQEGRTGKIPDAGCFRPWDRGHARLRKFHLETCGDLLFLSFADDPPPLREFLGDFFDRMARSFAVPFRLAWKWEVNLPCNWKVPVENTLEAYHVPCLHSKTLDMYPPETDVAHVLDEKWSTLQTREYKEYVTAIQNWMLRRLGGKPTNLYVHHLVHPNTVFIGMDVFGLCMTFVPTSPTTSVQRVWMYTVQGPRRGPFAAPMAWVLRLAAVLVVKKVLVEDIPIFGAVQQGMQASRNRGVIGTLEERVYAFQNYVLWTCGEQEAAAPPTVR